MASSDCEIDPSVSMALAIEFLYENPSEKPSVAARIYHVNESTLRTTIQHADQITNIYGGYNWLQYCFVFQGLDWDSSEYIQERDYSQGISRVGYVAN